MALITDPDLILDSAADDGSEEVYINTSAKTIKLVTIGNLTTDGVTLKCLYSFLKEEWRDDPNTKNLAAFPFPMTPITDESFEFIDGWDMANDSSRYLIRTAGWTVRNVSGNVTQKWSGIIGLGTITAPDSGATTIDVVAASKTFTRSTGSFISDGFLPGMTINTTGFTNGGNNTTKIIDTVSALVITVTLSAGLVNESGNGNERIVVPATIYYEQGAGATNMQLTGQVNQAIQIIKDDDGDGVYAEGSDFDRRTTLALYCREFGQVYGSSNLSAIGVTSLDSIAYRFPISTSIDLNISNVDTTVGGANDPYQKIKIRYFSGAYTKSVDSGTGRNFGIVIDVGTHSGIDGAMTAAGNSLGSAAGGIPIDGTYDGGTLTIHEGTNAGTYTIGTIVSATAVPITTTFTNTQSSISFTLQRATPVSASIEEIYELVQYKLRQNADIDATSGSVTGKTADGLLTFVGSDLKCGLSAPTNPNGGGSGVIIEGFRITDTNSLTFYDNIATARNFPFVASLVLSFGANLIADASAKYWIYFTNDDAGDNAGYDYGTTNAIIVKDANNVDMTGNVSAQSSVTFSFNYDANVQRGATSAGTDAPITVVGIGLITGQYVKATGTIARSSANSVSLIAPFERNYANA